MGDCDDGILQIRCIKKVLLKLNESRFSKKSLFYAIKKIKTIEISMINNCLERGKYSICNLISICNL